MCKRKYNIQNKTQKKFEIILIPNFMLLFILIFIFSFEQNIQISQSYHQVYNNDHDYML